MKAETVEVLGLFHTDVRYLVPIFQRNYKWSEARHWKPLWVNICDVAEEVLEVGESGDVQDHFLGAIVCDPMPAYGLDAKPVSVIDGQQRLTTLALFIGAIHNVAHGRGLASGAYLDRAVRNDAAVVQGRVDHLYKVWPNPADRSGFVAAMEECAGSSRPEQAFRFFQEKINRWLDVGQEDDPFDDLDYSPEERMKALITAVMRFVKLVKIDLEKSDNPQLIFETLNGRGEKLTDADLVRNALFRRADQEGLDTEALYNAHWKAFDESHWSDNVAHGRHQRDRLSLYLNNWLSMETRTEVPASGLFSAFTDYLQRSKAPADVIAKELAHYGTVFDGFYQHPKNSEEWWFFRRIDEMDLITVYPVLLYLYGASEEVLPEHRRLRALKAIESFLVRRLITRSSTRGYGSLFIEVLQAAAAGPDELADDRIIGLLAAKTADTDRWPSDDEVRSAVLHTNIYKLKQSRLKMVLEAIDVCRSSDGNTESITLGHSLWIEHLLPQGWKSHPAWALSDEEEDPTAAALHRDHQLHTLGNLTLTTSKLDIGLSNRPWPEKLAELTKHSSLQLNRDLLVDPPAVWNESEIERRGLEICTDIVAIWPSADSLVG